MVEGLVDRLPFWGGIVPRGGMDSASINTFILLSMSPPPALWLIRPPGGSWRRNRHLARIRLHKNQRPLERTHHTASLFPRLCGGDVQHNPQILHVLNAKVENKIAK